MHVRFWPSMTYPCGPCSISICEVVDTDLVYSIRHIHQTGGVNKLCLYPSRPGRTLCFRSGYVSTLHTARVYLWHVTIRSGRVDLNCVGDLVAIHWLREMEFE